MKISEIYIKNYLQFRDFHLNLTYPDTGEPLDKICFIGANGTGKSNLLKIIRTLLLNINNTDDSNLNYILSSKIVELQPNSLIYFSIEFESESIYILCTSIKNYYFSDSLLNDNNLSKIFDVDLNFSDLSEIERDKLDERSNDTLLEKIKFTSNSHDIISYSNSDGSSLIKNDFKEINISQSLAVFKDLPIFNDVSYSNVDRFWKALIYQIKKREKDYVIFMDQPEIQDLKISEAKRIFSKKKPEILENLAKQWNLILERAGLEFNTENVKLPVLFEDNLEAYIRLKNSKKNIPYNNLSTGIRNFIFQLGHIYALYFNRDIKRGFLLIDEPESSLFPDLLYDLIDRYLAIIQNTQFFVATHSPIIAAQFNPAERFILEFDDDGYVNARSGVSPEGDDPNDLLANDFVVRSLYGKKGIEQWERYLYLRRKIVETEDKEEKKELLREYSKIGNAYNFLPNEISE